MAPTAETLAAPQLSTLPSDLPSRSLLTHQFSSSQSTALVSSPLTLYLRVMPLE